MANGVKVTIDTDAWDDPERPDRSGLALEFFDAAPAALDTMIPASHVTLPPPISIAPGRVNPKAPSPPAPPAASATTAAWAAAS